MHILYTQIDFNYNNVSNWNPRMSYFNFKRIDRYILSELEFKKGWNILILFSSAFCTPVQCTLFWFLFGQKDKSVRENKAVEPLV